MFCFLTSLAPRAEVFQLLRTQKIANSALQCDHINSDYSLLKHSHTCQRDKKWFTATYYSSQSGCTFRVRIWEYYVEICDEKNPFLSKVGQLKVKRVMIETRSSITMHRGFIIPF